MLIALYVADNTDGLLLSSPVKTSALNKPLTLSKSFAKCADRIFQQNIKLLISHIFHAAGAVFAVVFETTITNPTRWQQ